MRVLVPAEEGTLLTAGIVENDETAEISEPISDCTVENDSAHLSDGETSEPHKALVRVITSSGKAKEIDMHSLAESMTEGLKLFDGDDARCVISTLKVSFCPMSVLWTCADTSSPYDRKLSGLSMLVSNR